MDVIKNTPSIDYESPSLQWESSICAQICIFKVFFFKMISRSCISHLDMMKVWIPWNPLVLLWHFHIGTSLRLLLHARLLQVSSSISSISIVILTISLPIAYVPSPPQSCSPNHHSHPIVLHLFHHCVHHVADASHHLSSSTPPSCSSCALHHLHHVHPPHTISLHRPPVPSTPPSCSPNHHLSSSPNCFSVSLATIEKEALEKLKGKTTTDNHFKTFILDNQCNSGKVSR